MAGITIFREITLKQIVTADSKEKTRQQLREQMVELNKEQIAFEENKNSMLTEVTLKGADSSQLNKFRQQFNTRETGLHVARDEIRTKIMAVDELRIDEEVVVGSIEGPYELKVGDRLDKAATAEIVIKDGIIVEIRQ